MRLLTYIFPSDASPSATWTMTNLSQTHGVLYKNAGSTHDVEPITVALETGELSLEEKLAHVPDAPDPVLLYSAYVT